MLFNSVQFLVFFPIVFVIYWFVVNKKLKIQNLFLLIASYYFYAQWDWRFLFLLMFSTLLDFTSGIQMEKSKTKSQKKFWFWLCVIINVGFLGVFKYYDFFAQSFADILNSIGFKVSPILLKVILPVGISFYTFHGLSYVIDIYKDRIKAERNFVEYALFVSFFPLLVAGPIERATHLLPQVKKKRVFNYNQSIDGLRQILWGLFKKIVIADNCAVAVEDIFHNYQHYSSIVLILGAVLFAIQIYCDFSGYSDIALGTARLLGFELLQNFSFPYFSRDIAEFWRRWHISLTTWFRDYLYIPLGGSKGGVWMKIRNTFIIFLVSGFWHGANWTFIIWGALNALFFIPLLLNNRNRTHLDTVAQNAILPSFKELFQMLLTFVLVTIGWIFFRAKNVAQAIKYYQRIFSNQDHLSFSFNTFDIIKNVAPMIVVLIIFEWWNRRERFGLQRIIVCPFYVRWAIYYALIFCINYYGGKSGSFIYFQF